MGCVIDHLQTDHRVRVLQDFTDARGTRYVADETAILRAQDLDWAKQEIVLEWEREGRREKLHFALAAKDGPGNGRMRAYFALEDRVASPRAASAKRATGQAPEVPALSEELVRDAERYADALTRVWALAARRRFREAQEQVRAILATPDPYGGTLERLAGDLVNLAVAHAQDDEDVVYQWLRERSIDLWYAWGSQATSGGEGAYRAQYIRAAEERLAQCDAGRR